MGQNDNKLRQRVTLNNFKRLSIETLINIQKLYNQQDLKPKLILQRIPAIDTQSLQKEK